MISQATCSPMSGVGTTPPADQLGAAWEKMLHSWNNARQGGSTAEFVMTANLQEARCEAEIRHQCDYISQSERDRPGCNLGIKFQRVQQGRHAQAKATRRAQG